MKSELDLFKQYLISYQQDCVTELEQFEFQKKFNKDCWKPHSSIITGGECCACVLEDGLIFEKAGVNFSHVFGQNLPQSALKNRQSMINNSFEAMGVSIVIHPNNPFVPTTHANFRIFTVQDEASNLQWWVGGGFDLTPYYGFEDDCVLWHLAAKEACDPFGLELYGKFKEECDNYFYLPHRNEPRGIGGIFFDDLILQDFNNTFQFIKSVSNKFIKCYTQLVNLRKDHHYEKKHKDFQQYRRGRYVEFNLLYDRGTLFGLQSGGKTEAILMSLPPNVTWKYNWYPQKHSQEEELYTKFLKKRAWI